MGVRCVKGFFVVYIEWRVCSGFIVVHAGCLVGEWLMVECGRYKVCEELFEVHGGCVKYGEIIGVYGGY